MAKAKNKAVSLSDIQFSQTGEQQFHQEPVYIPTVENISNVLNEENENQGSGNVIFRLVDNNKKGGVYIDCEDYVINPKTKQMDSIHLLVGENEIWGSELKEKYGINFNDTIHKIKRLSLKFENRTLTIPDWDTPAIEFLRHTRYCIDNKHNKIKGRVQYYEYNPLKEAELANYRMTKEMEAMEKLFSLDEGKVKKLCIYLNIPLNDTLGEIKPIQLLKRDLGIKIKNDPENFLNLSMSEEVEINYMVLKAIKDSKIDISQINTNGKIYWATGSLICASIDNNAKNTLVQLALSKTNGGNEFLEQLKKVLI
jgi:hypothetical protein